MSDLNVVCLTGRITFDPELRRIPSGSAVCELRIACNNSFQNRDGERVDDTAFIDVTVWNKQAENCVQYLKKGSKVSVHGSLKMDQWDDKTTGEKRSKLKVQASQVIFLDSKPSGDGHSEPRSQGGQRGGYEQRGGRSPAPQPQGRGAAPQGRGNPNTHPAPDQYDDADIPF